MAKTPPVDPRPLSEIVKGLNANELLELKKAIRELEEPPETKSKTEEKEWEEFEDKVRAACAAQVELDLISGRIARRQMRLAVPLGWESVSPVPSYTSLVLCGPRPVFNHGGVGGTAFGAACGGSGGTAFGAACGGSGGTAFSAACGGSGGTAFGAACGGSGGTAFGAACGGSGGTAFGAACGGSGGTAFGAACGGSGGTAFGAACGGL